MATVIRGDDNFDTAINGRVLQVVSSSSTTGTYPTTSFTDVTSSSISITPTSSSSKILYTYTSGGKISGGSVNNCSLNLLRDSTVIKDAQRWGFVQSGSLHVPFPLSVSHVDSPNTTSAVTYKIQLKEGTSGNWEINDANSLASAVVILMEIAG